MKSNTGVWAKMAASIFFCGLAATCAQAQSSDALLNKLVSKGILTDAEAKELAKDLPKPAEPSKVGGLPSWVNSLKIYGDFRARYDGAFENNNNYMPVDPSTPSLNTDNAAVNKDRNQFRYRLRLGVTATMVDHFEVGMRLSSGQVGATANASQNASPFSANQTEGNDAARKGIFIDLAYAKWTPTDWFQAQIGKMNNDFWFTDMLMDPDYNPEGMQEKFGYDINANHRVNVTSGQFVIQENFNGTGTAANSDVYLFVNQLDWQAKWSKKLSSRAGVALMNFLHQSYITTGEETFIGQYQNGTPAINLPVTVPATGGGTTTFNVPGQSFNPIIGRAEVTYTLDSFPCFKGAFPITALAEYANNPAAPSDENQAYNFGGVIGSSKLKGNWQLSYNYKSIQSAAVWRGLNDDDFGYNLKGGTDVRGHQVIASYKIADPLTFSVRYMHTEWISNPAGQQAIQDRVFVDLLWAF